MRIYSLIVLKCLTFAACSTTSNTSNVDNPEREFDLSCEVLTADGKTLQVYVQSVPKKSLEASNENRDVTSVNYDSILTGSIKNNVGSVVHSQTQIFEDRNLTTESNLTLKIAGESVQLSFMPQPTITRSNAAGSCAQIYSRRASKVKAPQCNAAGTPAQGWYVAGQLIRYDQSCHNATLSCGQAKTEGWFLQKKTGRVQLTQERCSWNKNTPHCEIRQGTKGWYLENRLIARDDECVGKAMECSTTKDGEGWVAFKRSIPEFYADGRCRDLDKTAARASPIIAH